MRTVFEHFSGAVALALAWLRSHRSGEPLDDRLQPHVSERGARGRVDAVEGSREAALVGQPRAQLLCETLGVFACYELGDAHRMQAHLDQEMGLIRQLGARRFEAQNMELRGRLLLDAGERREAERVLRASLALCREVGMQFSAPKTLGAVSLAVGDESERARLLEEGAGLLARGAVGNNHLWFHRDAIEAMLMAGDAAGALRHVAALEDYTRAEPLPWSQLFAALGRSLAGHMAGGTEKPSRPGCATRATH